MKIIKKLALALVAAIVAVLLFATTRPNALHVERTTTINAPADKIFPYINDFHQWKAWSPYEQRDPDMKRTYSRAPAGQGSVYEWQGNSNVGSGRMEITGATPPSKIVIKLDFSAPIEGHNIATFTMQSSGAATNVTWAMDGPTPYLGKVIGVFMNMDRMIGTDFVTGLDNLKRLAES